MTKWRYMTTNIRAVAAANDTTVEDVLNEYGNAGWELVTMDHDDGQAYFKRANSWEPELYRALMGAEAEGAIC